MSLATIFSLENLCGLKIYFYLCKRSEKDSLLQKKRYALYLRDENLRNFHCKSEIGRRYNGFHVLRGAVIHFLFQVFSGPSSRNWHKQSRASAM